MQFAEFIAPMPVEQFMADFYGRRPLHLKADGDSGARRRQSFSWARLGELLEILPHWNEANLKLIFNSRPLAPENYIVEVDTLAGRIRRASPAKVEVFLGMGASLVADSLESVAPEIHSLTHMLSTQFRGRSGANAYCSFAGVQAFKSHCDLHEVFAVHCEGEKVWRIYENRAASPVVPLEVPDAQAIIDQVKGRVMMEAQMQPGDLLYIPRGYYHDALASSDASLHLSLSVTPHSGRILFRLLEELAMQDPAFRAYLPDGRIEAGAPLRDRLAALAEKTGAMMRTPRFEAEVQNRQQALIHPPHRFSLPSRPTLSFYSRTSRAAQIIYGDSGASLHVEGTEFPLGQVGEPAEWLLGFETFSAQQLFAQYPWLERSELAALIELLVTAGIFIPHDHQRS